MKLNDIDGAKRVLDHEPHIGSAFSEGGQFLCNSLWLHKIFAGYRELKTFWAPLHDCLGGAGGFLSSQMR